MQVVESERVHSSSSHSSDEVTGAGAGGMGGGSNNNNKWEALSLVPDRDVEGLVTRSVSLSSPRTIVYFYDFCRKWDKRQARKPRMMIKKCKFKSF